METCVLLTAAIVISEPFIRSTFNTTPVQNGGPFDDLILRGYEFDYFTKIFEEVLHFRFKYVQFVDRFELITKLTTSEVDIIVNPQPAAKYFAIKNSSRSVLIEERHILIYLEVPIERRVSSFKLFSMNALLVCIGFTIVTIGINKFGKKYLHESAFIQVMWILIVTCLLGLFTNLMAVRLVIPNKTTKPYVDVQDLVNKVKLGDCTLWAPDGAVMSALSWKRQSKFTSIQHLINVGIGRNEMVQRILSETCTVGIDFDLGSMYNKISCHLGTERIMDSPPSLYTYLYSGLNMTKKMIRKVDTVLASRVVQDSYQETKKLYFNVRFDTVCDSENEQGHHIRLSVTKLGDPFSIMLVGMALSLIVCILEWIQFMYD